MIYVNNKKVETFNFPAGEVSVKLPEPFNNTNIQFVKVTAFLKSSDDILALLLTINAIKNKAQGIVLGNLSSNRLYIPFGITLRIPYFPYARQDRVCNEGEALSGRVMAELINNLNLNGVQIMHPHSDVVPALLNNCVIEYAYNLFENVFYEYDEDNPTWDKVSLVSPDAGAAKYVSKLKNLFDERWEIDVPLITATKVRDTKTGWITETKLNDPVTKDIAIIVDDICDGGATFIPLAKALKEAGAKEVWLSVTHGIFSKGFDELSKHIDKFIYKNTLNQTGSGDPYEEIEK